MKKLKPPFKLNVPMVLTWMRIALIPLVIVIFYLPETWMSLHSRNALACVLFIIASVTDALDGYLARKYEGWATNMGAFLDPVADKLLVCTALVVLVGLGRLDMLIAMIIIGREITVSALREWMAKIGESAAVKVNWFGKFKTIAQMMAIPMLLWWDPLVLDNEFVSGELSMSCIGTVLIWIAAVLTVYSMVVYLNAARHVLKE